MRALHARAVDRWRRPGGFWSRRTEPPTASILARIGETVVVGLIVSLLVPALAGAATPDRAPQPTNAAAGGSAPQPQPQAQSAPSSAASSPGPTASQPPVGASSPTLVTPVQSGGSVGVVLARRVTGTSAATRRRAVHAPRSSRPSASAPSQSAIAKARVESAAATASVGAAVATTALTLAGVRDLVRFPNSAALIPAASRHSGVLLLLGSLALAALVVASLALLRRVARLRAGMWEGSAR
jgi:hypothetical protein